MKTNSSRLLIIPLAALLAFPISVWALDIRIPHPKKIVREVRGTVHRVAREVEGTGRRVVRSVTSDPAPAPRGRTGSSPAAPRPGTTSPRAGPDDVKPVSTIQDTPSTSVAPANASQESVSPSVRPFEPKDLPDTSAGPQATSRQNLAPSSSSSEVPFARPVPGKKGMVYTPGSDETPESIVDVRDFAPGTLVKNPKTGVLFRVP